MDQGLGYLFAAFFVAWLALVLYLWSLSGRLSSLRRELDALKSRESTEDLPEE
jgi:CcmD family protein